MKSVRVDAFSQGSDRIRIEQVPVPEPGPGQVRVRMLMSPVHPSDMLFMRGTCYRCRRVVAGDHNRRLRQGAFASLDSVLEI